MGEWRTIGLYPELFPELPIKEVEYGILEEKKLCGLLMDPLVEVIPS